MGRSEAAQAVCNRYRFIDDLDAKGKPQHRHELDGKPLQGTSTVLSVLQKFGITWWASRLACESLGWSHPNIDGTRKKKPLEDRLAVLTPRYEEIQQMGPEAFLGCLDEAYRAHSVKLDTSADAGTDMHACLEAAVKWCIKNNDGKPVPFHPGNDGTQPPAVDIFSTWARVNVSRFIASEAHCYSERLWTGGIFDLLYRDNDDKLVLFDFKSSKETYASHFLQNAGYDIAVRENGLFTSDGEPLGIDLGGEEIAYYGVFPFGAKVPQPEFSYEKGWTTAELRKVFEHCVDIYKFLSPTMNKF